MVFPYGLFLFNPPPPPTSKNKNLTLQAPIALLGKGMRAPRVQVWGLLGNYYYLLKNPPPPQTKKSKNKKG